MKYFKILAILLFSSVISFYACNDNDDARKQEARESLEVSDSPTLPNAATPNPAGGAIHRVPNSPSPTNATTPDAATPKASQNAGRVWHYTCSNGCAGGAGSAVNCESCGSLLAHNQAYHANPNSTSIPIPFTSPPAAEAGKNTAGVWHYTCAKGCAGGSGTAGTCGTCGGTLAHNTAYHQ